MQSRITGVGSYIPPKRITNTDLTQWMETSDEWIVQRTGIQARHWVDANTCTSDLAKEAALKAIEDAGIKKDDIDMVIFATLSPDHDFPGTGCFLQAKLDLPEIAVFDIRQQCTGFLYGLSLADKMIQSGQYKCVLLVGAEVHSKGLDLSTKGRDVSVLFGDGAGAVIVQPTEAKGKIDSQVFSTHLYADGKFAKELWVPSPGSAVNDRRLTEEHLKEGLHFPHMNGKTVFVHATRKMAEVLTQAVKTSGFEMADVDVFFFHQANLRINEKVAELLKLPSEKVFNTIMEYGNTTAATIPVGMDEAKKADILKPGMLVASAAFGSGFTWGAGVWRY